MLLGKLGVSLLGNMLSGDGVGYDEKKRWSESD